MENFKKFQNKSLADRLARAQREGDAVQEAVKLAENFFLSKSTDESIVVNGHSVRVRNYQGKNWINFDDWYEATNRAPVNFAHPDGSRWIDAEEYLKHLAAFSDASEPGTSLIY